MALKLVTRNLRQANAYVAEFHRHHKEVQGQKFSVGVADENGIVGVAIVGRPVANLRDDGETAEILRCCTNGAKNACTKLYGACARAAAGMGYTRIITYTLESESGASLRAAGFEQIGVSKGGEWSCPSRPRRAVEQPCPKKIWQRNL